MLSKDLSTRIMKQEFQLSSEIDVQNNNEKSKTKKRKNIKQSWKKLDVISQKNKSG